MAEFKLIIAGGRDFNDWNLFNAAVHALCVVGPLQDELVSIVSGAASGADGMAIQFAGRHNVKLYTAPANWDKYGKGAGFIRNKEMGDMADGLLAFWDGESRGTKHMIDYMRSLGKKVWISSYVAPEVLQYKQPIGL